MIYGVLYDSMIEMYRRQKIEARRLGFYAITSLAGMEFLNCLSIIVLLAYFNVGIMRELFHNSGASKIVSAVAAVSLLFINHVYAKFRARSGESRVSFGARRSWIASAYIVCSVAIAIYLSTLVSTFKR